MRKPRLGTHQLGRQAFFEYFFKITSSFGSDAHDNWCLYQILQGTSKEKNKTVLMLGEFYI